MELTVNTLRRLQKNIQCKEAHCWSSEALILLNILRYIRRSRAAGAAFALNVSVKKRLEVTR